MGFDKLRIITIDQKKEWNEALRNCNLFDVYYKYEYVKAFQLHGDGEPLLIYYEDDNTRAINVVMKRDISLDKNFTGKLKEKEYFDLSTPYGYGGFFVDGNVNHKFLENLDKNYCEHCVANSIISEFVRFHPIFNNDKYLSGIYNTAYLGKTIAIDLDSEDLIWSHFTSENRNMVRKARKNDIHIYWGRSLKLADTFAKLYYKIMDKDNAQVYYYFNQEFFLSILDDLKNHSMIFYAELEGKIISCAIIMFSKNQMHYHLSAQDMNYSRLAPTNLLLYEAAKWGCNNGYKTFHLGGGLGGKADSLYKFKASFNKNSDCKFYIGKKTFNQEIYNKLCSMRGISEENGFFPNYRLAY